MSSYLPGIYFLHRDPLLLVVGREGTSTMCMVGRCGFGLPLSPGYDPVSAHMPLTSTIQSFMSTRSCCNFTDQPER